MHTLDLYVIFIKVSLPVMDGKNEHKKRLSQGSSTFWVRGPIYIFHIILGAAVIADYKIIMDILNIIIGARAARQVT